MAKARSSTSGDGDTAPAVGSGKIGMHLEPPLRRALVARAEAAGLSEGQMAKQLLKECLEGKALMSSQDEIRALKEQVEELKVAVESLRTEVATTFNEDRTTPELKPLLQELRNDIATAIHAALTTAGLAQEKADQIVATAFPRSESESERIPRAAENP